MPSSNQQLPDAEAHLPSSHWPLPELSTVGPEHPHPAPLTFIDIQKTDEFTKLRSSFRNFAFPTVVAVLVWYFLYVLASVFAEGFMSTRVFGLTNMNLGMVFGLIQFPTTWFATWLYVRRANKVLDPQAAALREKIEKEVEK